MKNLKTIACIMGTRPEVIKLAPIILELKKQSWARVKVIVTAQHRQMLDDALDIFHIKPDIDLNVMEHDQTLSVLTANLIYKLDDLFNEQKFDAVLAVGDTTSLFMTSLICFYRRVAFGHVEAGLRTGDFYNPFPEEMNRTLTSELAYWQFAPTRNAVQNLIKQNIPKKSIFLTGNPVIDAMLYVLKKNPKLPLILDPKKKLLLLTAHRRESFGKPLRQIYAGVKAIADHCENVQIVYPVHPNPNVTKVADKELANHPRIKLLANLNYENFVALMKKSYLIMTDSGGVEEEAPILGKPILVLRNKTERPEIIKIGIGKLVGTNPKKIYNTAVDLIENKKHYDKIAKPCYVYGDGKAARRIVKILKNSLT